MSVNKDVFTRREFNKDFQTACPPDVGWAYADRLPETLVPTHCAFCGVQCGMYLRVSDGHVTGVEACAVIGPRIDISSLAQLLGSEADAVEECHAIGLLRADGLSLVFRNELGREAVLESVSPTQRLVLHRAILKLLRQHSIRPDDLAQLAHHAEASGDADAVLEFAPLAGRRAASLSAHREAVAQYQRALGFANRLEPEERARLLEALAHHYWVTDQVQAAIEGTRLLALEAWRSLGNRLKEGDCLRQLSRHYWFATRGAEAEQAMLQAVEILESLPPGPELAWAYNVKAAARTDGGVLTEGIQAAQQAIAVAQQFGCDEAVVYARNTLGNALVKSGTLRGFEELETSIAMAQELGLEEHVMRGYSNLCDRL